PPISPSLSFRPTLTQTGQPQWRYHHPKCFEDNQPAVPIPIEQLAPPTKPFISQVILHVRDFMRTAANSFGLLHEYNHHPSYDPDEHVVPEDLVNFKTGLPSTSPETRDLPDTAHTPPPWPLQNVSKFLFMNWANSGSTLKTGAEVTRLGREVLSSPDFKLEDLGSFNAHRENQQMDAAFSPVAPGNTPSSGDGWREVKVDIEVPVASRAKPSPPSRTFTIPEFHFHPLMEVIKAAWSEDIAKHFHLSPFK
ncbi:hypothetical protein L208DRAFT_1327219, partial [Tricholoma matsutake]